SPEVVVPMEPYGQQAPYGQQPAPYGQQPPYGQQAAPYGQQTPYGQQAAPYGQQNPYGQQAAPYSQHAPYGQQGAPYRQQAPYGQQTVPYGQQASPQNGFVRGANEQLGPYQYEEGGVQDPSGRMGRQPSLPLRPFGYSLFAGAPTTFAPVTEIPIPTDYILGPGDSIRLQMFGKENQQHELQVSRDGTIELPQSGPMPVAGLDFDEVKQQLTRWVREKYIGVDAAVSLGELRSMQVFILGEARTPGAYTVSSLSTMTNALFVSGGVKLTGSLRKVQLKRQGKQIAELDLYDLLLRGDTSDDRRLMPGDVIFIPPVGTTAAIEGEVRRPAI